ncbi:MAG: 50S ribosomal protein L11 methyltransferase [Acidiferrobacteraceae bacterium]|jgi:ribosomal protein L11 methyltransferase
MPWQRLIIDTERDLAQELDDWLAEQGAISVSLQDSGDEPLFDQAEAEKPLWSRTTVVALFEDGTDLSAVMDALGKHLAPTALPPWHSERLSDQQWERVWLERFRPVHVAGRLWISPHNMNPPDADAITVFIDPGLAFGTGTHPTTLLCLQWLAGLDLSGCTVLDYGCGSGILAIAALKLGARQAWGVDNDPTAVQVALDNARINGVADRFSAFLPEALPTGTVANITVANILAEPLVELATELTRLTAHDGQIALSGILEHQVDVVRKSYDTAFTLEVESRDGWACLSGPRKQGALKP